MSVIVRGARVVTLLLTAGSLLAACGYFDDEEKLPGERIRLRANDTQAEPDVATRRSLAPAQTLANWTQTNGQATHNSGNLNGPTSPSIAWRADAGQGNSDDSWITSPPIAVDGRVFTLDAASTVTAFDSGSGSVSWETDVSLEDEDGEEGFGGGLAAEGQTIFVTTGFGEVLALSAASGEILWRQRFDAPFRAAPSAANGIVVAVARDNQAYALRGATGDLLWRDQGVAAEAAFLGGSTAAIAGGLVILPYSSGEMVALDIGTGRAIWSAVVTGGRRGLARASITDLTGDPVVAGPFVLGANQSGRLIAINGRNGNRVWTRAIGATKPLWPVEDTMFLISDLEELTRVNLRDGSTLWKTPLPAFEDEEDAEDPITYSGPIVVSGKVLLTDSLENLWSFDAQSGEGGVILEMPDGSRTGPIVAGGTIFILTDEADLLALR
ncbi:MAG: PQQ-binding-like beta-propeller repeat protein [Pseudomonadota bacterium]